MMFAMLRDQVVIDVFEADPATVDLEHLPPQYVPLPDGCWIEDRFDGQTWTKVRQVPPTPADLAEQGALADLPAGDAAG